MRLVEDRERQVRSEKKLLRVQQRNLVDGTMELECERQLVRAEKAKLHSVLNKEKLEDLSSQIGTISPPPSVHGEVLEMVRQELEETKAKLSETSSKLQDALHQNDTLRIKVGHFEAAMQKENDHKEKEEQSYERFHKMMESFPSKFEGMVGTKDDEIRVRPSWWHILRGCHGQMLSKMCTFSKNKLLEVHVGSWHPL